MGTARAQAEFDQDRLKTRPDLDLRNVQESPLDLTGEEAASTETGTHRIAILTRSLSLGGVQKKALLIASGLSRRAHEVDLLLLSPECDYPDEIPERCRLFFVSSEGASDDARTLNGPGHVSMCPVAPEIDPWRVRCWRAARMAVLYWRQLPFLARTRLLQSAEGIATYLARERPAAILAMHIHAVVACAIAIRLAHHQVRMVATIHKAGQSKSSRRRIAAFYSHADAVVGISPQVTAHLARTTGMPAERIHTIYNPIVSAELARDAVQPNNHPWLDGAGCPVILAAGRLRKEKDFSTLLAGFATLLKHRPARLIVLGKGPLLSTLQSQAKDLRIEEHVDFPGFVENPYSFMARTDLFVLSSRVEGLPTVIVEAMACGCPVVSTDCPFGPAEILEGGRLGELVSVGDSRALADAMDRTLNTPPDRSALRGRAEFFGVDRAVDRYEALLLDRLPLQD